MDAQSEHCLEFAADLPIAAFRQAILASVDHNQVTIVTAETGAGKSTQVPQYLAEHGYRKVVVTQPRIIAARSLSARVREEISLRTGREPDDYVGYRTSYERDDTENTVILYCTDGLQLVREITGAGTGERQVLLLDEIHEWNENMEVLIAWAKKRCQEDRRFKVVIMSATIEAEHLSAYFGAGAPITVPGRSYEIAKSHAGDLLDEAERQLAIGGRNILVFLPGKSEIEYVAERLKKAAQSRGVPVIPLHSQLEASEQEKVFEAHAAGKVILSTNIAQTSLTIDDIDVVIDSGLERRSEVRDGVEGLFMAEVSRADCLQRAGRAGRTKKGEYILASYERMPCPELAERLPYAVPEILRKHLDRLVLRLASVSIDIESLEFYHAPAKKAIRQAKQKLITLGAMTLAGEVTGIGRKMERFPVESGYARMLVEAEPCGSQVRAKLAAVIAIQEVGGIVRGGSRFNGWRLFTRQTESDLLAHYDLYVALPHIDPELFEEFGIVARNVLKAQEVLSRLGGDLGIDTGSLTPVQGEEEASLRRCIVAGQIDQLWLVADREATHIITQRQRELSGGTVVSRPALVVGTPFDLQVPTSKGLETLHLIQDVTTVDPAWLESLAPQLFKVRRGKVYFDHRQGTLATQWLIEVSDGTLIEGVSTPVTERNSRNFQLFAELYAWWLHDRLEANRRYVQKMSGERIAAVALATVQERVRGMVGDAVSVADLSKRQLAELEKLTRVQTYADAESVARLDRPRRRGAGGPGKRPGRPRGARY